ncbi:ABC transporter ATP-binding protein [Candidatus Dojkabacteria bacterium]|uniref:ABC transporter ATP-binding protein n=1 Tax=Candidatus Dojkabacteria bacterium TaxID=2099670 RepID=A0A955RHP1_9BACT|nr:ABC transporter ATP-binding protein [Candidatus Dojkabacteria bacterium]
MPLGKTILKVENVSKAFRIPHENINTVKSLFLNPFRKIEHSKFIALEDISFELKQGEFLGIIGRNGSGKSTLLKLIANIYAPDEGKIEAYGKIVPFLELGVGFNPELTARENVYLNGTILGMSKKFLNKKYEEIMEFAEVKEFEDMPLKNFSSGMYVRLAFSIAIQAEADIYLLDEVLSVGDSRFQDKSRTKFKELIRKGSTVVFVSHDLASLEKYCDRSLLLEKGKVIYFGETKKALHVYHEINMDKDSKAISSVVAELEKPNTLGDKTQRWGNKIYQIESIKMLDSQNQERKTFNYNEQIKFEIKWKSRKTTGDLFCGLGMYNQDDDYILGTNTEMVNMKLGNLHKTKQGVFSLEFPNINLLNGRYYINVVLYGDKETDPYDFVHKAMYFRITNSPKFRGIVNLNHKWKNE